MSPKDVAMVILGRALWVGMASLCATSALAAADERPPPAATGTIDAHARKEVLDTLAQKLESQYVLVDVARKLAKTVRAKEKANAYKNITQGPELARALTDDLFAVAHDKHLRVAFSFSPLPQGPLGPPPLEFFKKLNGMIPKLEILDGNVGYMRVNGVPPIESARAAVAASFAFLHNTDALIIDNRENHGGDPNTVAWYVSHLSVGPSYLVNTFHWREGNRTEEFKTTELGELSYGTTKPVFVLTSAATFSGGEELAYDLQALKRGVIVGEVTGGGANPGGPRPLGHHFLVNMPGGQAVNAVTGTNWEGVGVKPDIPVPAPDALTKAHALAIDRLVADAADPPARAVLEALAMKLESEAESSTATRLTNAQIVGTYTQSVRPDPPVTILEKDGQLMQHIDGFPDRTLTYQAGNRYRRGGGLDESIDYFRAKDGKTQLLMRGLFEPSLILTRQ